MERGKVEKNIFFIKKGIVRAYTSVDGKEITFWFGKEGATIVSLKGYVNDEPGYETMELMEDSVLYKLERKQLKELFLDDRFGKVQGAAGERTGLITKVAIGKHRHLFRCNAGKPEPD